MSYRRKVHCRHCGETGHNRNGCEKLKEYIKNNPNSYSAHRHNERLESMKHRKCSYCNTEGHNRKTCSHIMADMIKVAGINQDFRKKFMENVVRRAGIAPGGLITVNSTSGYDGSGNYLYDLKDKMALILDIDTKNIRYPNRDSGSQVVKIQFMDVHNYEGKGFAETYLHIPNWFILGKEPPTDKWYRNKLEFKVISPGYYEMDDENAWIKDKDVIQRICDEYGNHSDLEYAFQYLDK